MQQIQSEGTEIVIQDPFKCFPYDVWVNCVCFAAYGEIVGPLSLLSVSREWEKGIIETPEAWVSIVIDNGEDTLARVNVLLELSKNLPIDLHILYPDILWEALRLVLKHKSRIRAIIVRRSGSKTPDTLPLKELLDLLEVQNGYPQLEDYIVDGYQGHGRYKFISQSPKLVKVQFLLKNTVFPMVRLQKLKGKPVEFPISFKDKDNIKNFEEATYLTSPYIDNMRGSDKVQPQFRAIAPYLERLYYIIVHDGQIGSFVGTSYPRLHSLTVLMPPTAIQAVVSSIHLFPNLKNLDLYLRFLDSVSSSRTLKTLDGPQLHSFILRSHASVKSHDVENVMNDLAQTRILERARSLSFKLLTNVAPATLMNVLRTAPQVRVLNVYIHSYEGPRDYSPLSLPQLEILKINSLDDFGYINAPNICILSLMAANTQLNPKSEWKGETITSLSTDSGSFDKLRNHILQDEPERQLFPSLAHINWAKCSLEQGFQTTLLTSITCVTFSSPTFYNGKTKMAPIDAFCLSILQFPDACPALEAIMSWDYPCWDLFIQVLQLRKDNSGVKNIKSTGLPGYPVLVILDMLIHILNGDGDELKSSGEIEEVIQKRLTIHNACAQCILAGYIHCGQTKPKNASAEDEHGISSDTMDYIPLPTIVSLYRRAEVEARGTTRDSGWWKQLLVRRNFEKPSREEMCPRHSHTLTTITPYILG